VKLTPEQIEENLACYRQAMETGSLDGIKLVAFKSGESYLSGNWADKAIDIFSTTSVYRRKPKPTLRPWKPEEVPVGALFKTREEGPYVISCMNANRDGILFIGRNQVIQIFSLTGLSSSPPCLHSLDYGKTWLPCGVVE